MPFRPSPICQRSIIGYGGRIRACRNGIASKAGAQTRRQWLKNSGWVDPHRHARVSLDEIGGWIPFMVFWIRA
jgi:hypothetical protein